MIGNETDKHNVRLNITYKKRILHKAKATVQRWTLTLYERRIL